MQARHAASASRPVARQPAEPLVRPTLWSALLDAGIVAVLVLVHLQIQWRMRPPPHWADATDVYTAARVWPHVDTVHPTHHAMRIGSLIPARLLIDLLGPGQVSFALFPALCGAVLVGTTYALARQVVGRSWAGRAAGLLAATGLVFCPFLVDTPVFLTSWQLLPDVPAAALTTLGFVLLLAGTRRAPRDRRWGPGRDTTWLVGAGLAIGWAYLVREYMAFVFPAVFLAVLVLRLPWRRWIYLGVPAGLCWGLELANGEWVYGNPFARLTEASAQGEDGASATTRDVALKALWWSGAHLGHPRGGTIVGLAILTLVAPLVVRRRAAVVVALWAAFFWVGLTLSTGVLHPATPSLRAHVLFRYWLPLLPAVYVCGVGAVVAAAALVLRAVRPVSLRPVLALAGCAALTWWYVQPGYAETQDATGDREWNHLRIWLQAYDPGRVLTDSYTAQTLGYYRFAPVGGEVQWGSSVDVLAVPDKKEQSTRGFQLASKHPDDDVFVLGPGSIKSWDAAPDRGWAIAWEQGELCVMVNVASPLADELHLTESQAGCAKFARVG